MLPPWHTHPRSLASPRERNAKRLRRVTLVETLLWMRGKTPSMNDQFKRRGGWRESIRCLSSTSRADSRCESCTPWTCARAKRQGYLLNSSTCSQSNLYPIIIPSWRYLLSERASIEWEARIESGRRIFLYSSMVISTIYSKKRWLSKFAFLEAHWSVRKCAHQRNHVCYTCYTCFVDLKRKFCLRLPYFFFVVPFPPW